MKSVRDIVVAQNTAKGALKEPPPYKYLKIATPKESRVYFFNKEQAQALVRIEFGDGQFDEAKIPPVQLFNDYFSGGMAGIVFQELREARALAYSVGAAYASGGRKKEENIMYGAIGCQADKTPEALAEFLELLDKVPSSPERFADTRDSIISRYRTGKLTFREIIGAVRSWERLEVPIDPHLDEMRSERARRVVLPAFEGLGVDPGLQRIEVMSREDPSEGFVACPESSELLP